MYTGYQIYQAERPKSAREQHEIDMSNAKLAEAIGRFGRFGPCWPGRCVPGARPGGRRGTPGRCPAPLPRDQPVAARGPGRPGTRARAR